MINIHHENVDLLESIDYQLKSFVNYMVLTNTNYIIKYHWSNG